jgi:hypothetical protein
MTEQPYCVEPSCHNPADHERPQASIAQSPAPDATDTDTVELVCVNHRD